ncbi:hypothetical protein [Aestuariivita sp.]|jgi:hypothetical protein|uniref:hypothetical protein n=1 Tax=Aestuariivita sp. TaxID=1872407 RepID=UPI00216E4F13|nr:hypothetical protein [Aestuariivita sp.]MCE8008073.1 hypothetical protein [Aestuariivita sp.]
MSYYDNAVLMKLRLGLWEPQHTPKPYEIEAELLAQVSDTGPKPRQRRLGGLWRWAR